MNKINLLIILFALTACQDEYTINNTDTNEYCVGDNACSKNEDVTDTEEESDDLDLEGYYQLENNSYLELTRLNDGRYRLELQQLISTNYDGGLAYHPVFSVGPHVPRSDGSIYYAQNLNYSSTTNDVERDGSTSNITGSNRTEILIDLDADGYVKITITIKSGTSIVGTVLAKRTWEEE